MKNSKKTDPQKKSTKSAHDNAYLDRELMEFVLNEIEKNLIPRFIKKEKEQMKINRQTEGKTIKTHSIKKK